MACPYASKTHYANRSDRRIFEYIGTVPFHLWRTLPKGLNENRAANGILRQSAAARVNRKSKNRLGLECFLKNRISPSKYMPARSDRMTFLKDAPP